MPSPLPSRLSTPRPVRQAVLEAFEPRILYAADVAALGWAASGGLAGGVGVQAVQQSWVLSQELQAGGGAEAAASGVRELVVIDLSLPDAQVLLAGLQAQRDAGRPIEIITLQAQDDGMAVIGDALDQHQGLSALHLLTHGGPGHVQLGAVRLDATSLSWQAAEITRWSTAFAPGADWLIYGCDVAQGSAGQHFVQQLALLSGADVAASDDSTGALSAGGDWVLEQQTGPVQAALAADAPLQQDWQRLMRAEPLAAQFTVNQVADKNQNTNSLRGGSQNAVARASDGSFVVVWTSDGQDGDGRGVYARRFNHQGAALTPNDMQVNAGTTGDQQYARVAMADDGRFVVTWTTGSASTDTQRVRAAVYRADDVSLLTDIVVESDSTGNHANSVVGINRTTGEFVVAWEGPDATGSIGVFARRFNAAGVPQGNQQLVHASTAGDQRNPAVVMNRDGSYVVAWENVDASSNVRSIHFQRFNSAGAAQGGAVAVNDSTDPAAAAQSFSSPALAADNQGNFTVAFMGDAANPGAYFRSYLADGRALNTIQVVSNNSTASHVAIAAAADGSRLVTWRERNAATEGRDILAQNIHANGGLEGPSRVVNSVTTGDQRSPSAAMWDANHYVVVWSGRGSAGKDEVSARVYAEPPAAPRVSLPAGETVYRVTVNENQTAVATLTATDPNLPVQQLTWSIEPGKDGDEFAITSSGGVLSFSEAPNAEAPSDLDEDRVYFVDVRVTDSAGLSSVQAVQVTVVSVADEPRAVDKYVSVAPNSSVTVSPVVGDVLNNSAGALRFVDYRLSSSTGAAVPALGSVTENAGQLTYTAPSGSLTPPDRIQYLLDDGEQNLVSYWRLNDGNSPVARDELGNANGEVHGTPQSVPGAWGTAYQFGGEARVELPLVDDNGGYTLGFWFNLANVPSNANQVLLQQRSDAGALLEVRVRPASGGAQTGARELVTTLRGNGAQAAREITYSLDAANPATWYQYSLAVSPNQTAAVFIGGALIGSAQGVGTAAADLDDENLWFGGPKGSVASPESFTGAIDAVGLVGHPLIAQPTDGRVFGTYLDVGEILLGNAAPSVLTASADRYVLQEDTLLSTEQMQTTWFHADWAYRQRIQFANTAGVALQAVPVRLTLDTPTLIANGMDDQGNDLRFVDPNNPQTALAYQVESWTTTGTSVVWVSVPSIANGNSSSIHLYYGNPSAASGQSAQAMWGDDAAVVLHMGDTLTDRGLQAHSVSANSAASVTAGRVGSARSFNGTTSDVDLGSPSTLDNVFAGGGTISAWINPRSLGGGLYGSIADKASDVLGGDGWGFQLSPNNRLLFEFGATGGSRAWQSPADSIRMNQWTHVAVSYDSSNPATAPTFYINGQAFTGTPERSALGSATSDADNELHIGHHSEVSSRTFDGLIDEFRLWRETRTPAQITAEYRSTVSVTATLNADVERPGLLANDTGSGALRAVLLSEPTHGDLTWPPALAADGRFSYQPNLNFTGTDSFTYALTNGTSVSTPVTVTLEVQAQPDDPTITSYGGVSPANVYHAENRLHVARLTATDADAIDGVGETLTWSIVQSQTNPEWRQFVLDPLTGDLSFVALPDFESPHDADDGNNIYGFRVRVTDSSGRVDSQDLIIRVQDVVEQPIARSDTGTVRWNTPLNIDVRANDSSQEAAPLRVLDARGATVDDTNNRLVYTPGTDVSGDVELAYLLTDNQQGLQHYWRLDGNARDSIGSAHGEPDGGPTAVADGAWGQALRLDEVNDAVTLTDVSYANAFTLSMWFRLSDNVGTEVQTLFSHGELGTRNSLSIHLREDDNPLGTRQLRTRLVDADDTVGVDSALTLDASSFIDNQWHLYTLVVQQGQPASVYIDGVLRVSGTESTGAFNPEGSAVLGRSTNVNDTGRYFGGDLDGVSLFSRALSGTEVMQHYTGGSALGHVTVTVQAQENEAPVITPGAGGGFDFTAPEGSIWEMPLAATDRNLPAQTLTWTLGGRDTQFIELVTLDNIPTLRFTQAQNFEGPSGPPVWEVEVTVSDGALSTTQRITVTPSNVNEGPIGPVVEQPGDTRSVSETAPVGSTVGLTAVAVDPDGNVGVTYSLVNDAGGRFAINRDTGVVTVARSLAGGLEPSFIVTVKADSTDGSSSQAAFGITVVRTPTVGGEDVYTLSEDTSLSGMVANWWQPEWTARQLITANGNLPTGTPMRLTLNVATLLANGAATDGRDLRFVAGNGVQMAHVVESWPSATTNSSNAVIWVTLPAADGAAVTRNFHVYFGNPQATDSQNGRAVWGESALLVLGMGDPLRDLSGNNLAVSQSNTEAASGSNHPAGTARVFNSSNDAFRVTAPAGSALNNFFNGGGTFVAWVNPTSYGFNNNHGRIAARANSVEATTGWDLRMLGNGALGFEFGFGGGQHREWVTSANAVQLNQWQQVVVVFDATAGGSAAPKIYINGRDLNLALQSTNTNIPVNSSNDASIQLRIGGHPNADFNAVFPGTVDDVRIYDRALTETEVGAQGTLGRGPTFSVSNPPVIERPGVLANDNNGTSRGVALRAERDLVARATTAGGTVKMEEDGTFAYTPRANFFGTDTFTYRISDGLEANGQTVWSEPVTVTLNVVGRPDAPEIVSGGQSRMELSVREGQTDVGVITATDVDDTPSSPDPRTWEILTQTANGFSRDWERFSIDASTGRLSLRAPLDFETPQSAARSNTYDIAVRVTDSTGGTDTQNVVVSVTNVVEPPQADADTATAEYNTARTINVLANDSSPERRNLGVLDSERGKVEADQVTYTPTAAQSGVSETFRYRIYDGSEGLVHYWRMDETAVSVIGTATGITSAVTDTAGAFGRALSFNGIDSAVTLPSIAYHSTGWSFSFWFKLDDLDGSGVRTFFDHGTPGASTGRADRLSVMAFEANHADESLRNQLRTRLLMGETEVELDIPLAGSGASLLGGWHAYTVTASATAGVRVFIDDTPMRSSNTPIASFRPEGSAHFGRSTSITSPDRLRGAMDTVALWARVLSAGDVADWVRGDRTISTVTVNINARPPEPPRITSFDGQARATVDSAENERFIAQVQAEDRDLTTPASGLVYSIDPGPHAGLFTVDASSGRLSWSVAPNYESAPVSFTPRTYEVSVRVTDGTRSAAQLITVKLTDADEFDVSGLTDADPGDNVINQGAAVGTAVGVRMQAVDGDGTTNSVRYSLAENAGGLFMIDQFSGVIGLAERLGIDPPTEYQLRVEATSADGSRVDAPVTIKVERIPNRGPEMAAGVLLKIPENTRDVTVVQASDDAVPRPLSYRLAGGPDVGLFELNEATGELRLKQPADAESPRDANGDNRYELSVEAFDGLLTALQSIVLSIDNVDEAPSWAVNQMTITNGQVQLQIRADDVDTRADRLSYTVSEASGGWFAPSSSSSTRLGSFTQAQVQSGEVVFRLDGSGRTPSFSLGLTDGTSVMDIQQALVTVIGSIPVASVAAPPPAPAAPAPSAPPPAPRPAPAAEAPASAPAPERSTTTPTPARAASNAAETNEEAQGDKKSDAEREGVAGLGALLEGRATGEAAERAVGGRALSALMSGGPSAAGAFSAGAALAVRAADLAEATGLASAWRGPTVTAGDSSSGLRSSYSDTAEARTYSALMQAMNRVREDVTGEEVQVAVTVGSTALLSGSLSVGYVLWLLRGGVLMATVVSSVPAWAGIDPLPVLRQGRGADDDERDEQDAERDADPLERLFSKARKMLHKDAVAPSDVPSPRTATQADDKTLEVSP